MDDVLKFNASFDDGKLIIERQDGEPISIITHEQVDDCVEVLEINDKGHAVKALQCLLNCHGQHLEEDGIFGTLTQTALITFQDSKKLPGTGQCTALEWAALIGR